MNRIMGEGTMKTMRLPAAVLLLMLPAMAFGETQTITPTCTGDFYDRQQR